MDNKNNNGFKIDFNYDDPNIYNDKYEDISSNYTDISSSSKPEDTQPIKAKKKKRRKKHIALKIISVLLVLIIAFGISFYAYAYKLIDKINRVPLDSEDLGITTDTYSEVMNIALLGLDSREDNNSGRSDANVIVTIDKKNKKIKLTSIARDSYVAIEGRKNDKLTHAYAYGKSQLAVKTLNQNFGLEITDYVTMNFFGLARVIDYIGGVTLDVDEAEFNELNGYVFPTTDFGDIPCENLTAPGVQLLSGAQAVCYARIRHTDGDVERGNRQKEVITAMFAAIKKMNPFKLPELATMILNECETSLTTDKIMKLGMWAVLTTPEFEQLSIPNDNIPASGKTIRGVWYYVYDIEKAKTEIEDFIFERNYYSPEEVAKRLEEQETQADKNS
ncbi:MAG: LytR family transcriptional regulator [Ruminococcaceae bacterium]|jgi:LCP family protein required for cell wall assembly|nr:LytR family transcriptional regulator [Oscillospiraceae bacterium]